MATKSIFETAELLAQTARRFPGSGRTREFLAAILDEAKNDGYLLDNLQNLHELVGLILTHVQLKLVLEAHNKTREASHGP